MQLLKVRRTWLELESKKLTMNCDRIPSTSVICEFCQASLARDLIWRHYSSSVGRIHPAPSLQHKAWEKNAFKPGNKVEFLRLLCVEHDSILWCIHSFLKSGGPTRQHSFSIFAENPTEGRDFPLYTPLLHDEDVLTTEFLGKREILLSVIYWSVGRGEGSSSQSLYVWVYFFPFLPVPPAISRMLKFFCSSTFFTQVPYSCFLTSYNLLLSISESLRRTPTDTLEVGGRTSRGMRRGSLKPSIKPKLSATSDKLSPAGNSPTGNKLPAGKRRSSTNRRS